MNKAYKDDGWCLFCKAYTDQLVEDPGHERDSSGQRCECLNCLATYFGWTGKWTSKEGEVR